MTRWKRDGAGRPERRDIFQGREQVAEIIFQWRASNQIAGIVDRQRGAISYEHDVCSNLVAARSADGAVQYRSSDAVGNVYRTSDRSDRRYSSGGLLLESDGVRYAYDSDGQLVEKVLPNGGRWRYAWDDAGQLREVLRPDGRRITFAYDPLGRRTRKQIDGRVIKYVWDEDELLHEVDVDGLQATWLFEPGGFAPVAKVERQHHYGIITDHLGAPTDVFDEAGRIAWRAQLDLYGVSSNDVSLTSCPWRWPGQYEDEETGLYYNRFRYYDPHSGRFISQDPIGFESGLNPYAYVKDPILWIDPLGLTGKCKAWIKRDLYRKLPVLVGAADAKKFAAALKKGIVGPVGESGIKVLSPAVGKFTHELKIGGSAQRLAGYVENGVIVFVEHIRGGYH
jgi:RHS repeat-associated protein